MTEYGWADKGPTTTVGTQQEVEDELEEAVAEAYQSTETRTPLDSDEGFKMLGAEARVGEKVDTDERFIVDGGEVASDGETYDFTAKRFLGGTPAETITGTAHKQDGAWHLTFDDRRGILDRVRSFLANLR